MNGEEEKRWRLADLGKGLLNSFIAIGKGQFLLRLNPGRFFVHIVFTFLVFVLAIWISLSIDNTLTKVEAGKEELREITILFTDRTFNLASAQRRGAVSTNLEKLGSDLKEPQKAAVNIE